MLYLYRGSSEHHMLEFTLAKQNVCMENLFPVRCKIIATASLDARNSTK